MTALAKQQPNESLALSTARAIGMQQTELDLIKDNYAKGASDGELALFIKTANRLGLDITARQIFLVKRWDSNLQREVASPQTSIDGFRLIADRTGEYVPGPEATFDHDAEGRLISATAYVKKFVRDGWHTISATAFYDEYVQTVGGKNNQPKRPNSMWTKMPHLMLAKCAESLALRKAFPAHLAGIYTSEEMGQAHNEQPDRQPANPGPGEEIRQHRNDPSSASREGERPDQAPEIDAKRRELYVQTIVDLGKKLNAANDSIVWKGGTLKEFINKEFEVTDGLDALSFESMDSLIKTLETRLVDLEMRDDSDAVDGEIIDAIDSGQSVPDAVIESAIGETEDEAIERAERDAIEAEGSDKAVEKQFGKAVKREGRKIKNEVLGGALGD